MGTRIFMGFFNEPMKRRVFLSSTGAQTKTGPNSASGNRFVLTVKSTDLSQLVFCVRLL